MITLVLGTGEVSSSLLAGIGYHYPREPEKVSSPGPNCWVALPEMESATLFIPSSRFSG